MKLYLNAIVDRVHMKLKLLFKSLSFIITLLINLFLRPQIILANPLHRSAFTSNLFNLFVQSFLEANLFVSTLYSTFVLFNLCPKYSLMHHAYLIDFHDTVFFIVRFTIIDETAYQMEISSTNMVLLHCTTCPKYLFSANLFFTILLSSLFSFQDTINVYMSN